MTTSEERYRAIKQGRRLLEELTDPGRTPRVPSAVRDKARSILRHFPMEYDIERLGDRCPDILNNGTSIINGSSFRRNNESI
jgi:hypothetical protein